MNVNDLLPHQAIEFDEPFDPQIQAAAEIAEIARQLDLEDWIAQRLLHTERELTANLIVERPHGQTETVTAYRIQHFTLRGPTLGSVLFSPTAYLSSVRTAAIEATWQSALLNLPFGGAAGAVVCSPDTMSEDDLRQLAKGYGRAVRGIAGRDTDVIAPSTECNEQLMTWIADGIAREPNLLDPAAVVGKPDTMYGLPGYAEFNARGLVVLLQTLLERKRSDLRGLRVAIQGLGKSELQIARELDKCGASIVAVADGSGGLLCGQGIDFARLCVHLTRSNHVFGFDGAEVASNADVIESECDVLVAAGRERQIALANAERVRARVVVELSTGAVSNSAEELLTSQGKAVVPEILGNSGSAIAAFLEWKQSAQFGTIPGSAAELELRTRIETVIKSVVGAVASAAEQNRTTMKRAAHTLAIDHIAREMRCRK